MKWSQATVLSELMKAYDPGLRCKNCQVVVIGYLSEDNDWLTGGKSLYDKVLNLRRMTF